MSSQISNNRVCVCVWAVATSAAMVSYLEHKQPLSFTSTQNLFSNDNNNNKKKVWTQKWVTSRKEMKNIWLKCCSCFLIIKYCNEKVIIQSGQQTKYFFFFKRVFKRQNLKSVRKATVKTFFQKFWLVYQGHRLQLLCTNYIFTTQESIKSCFFLKKKCPHIDASIRRR